jgi:cardiolipin hydrolase
VLFFPDPTEATFRNFMSYIEGAQKSIDVAVFTISDDRISNYLIAASKTLRVRVITDLGTCTNKVKKKQKTQNDAKQFDIEKIDCQGSDIDRMSRAGIEVRTNASGLMHHKYAVLDDCCVVNGSFNWTSTAASENAENVIVTGDAVFVKKFATHFEEQWSLYRGSVYRPGLEHEFVFETHFVDNLLGMVALQSREITFN